MPEAKAKSDSLPGPGGGLAGFMLLCLVTPLAASNGEPVTGRVSDALNTPLAGATVTLQALNRSAEPMTAKTTKDGVYGFPEVPDGLYSLEASMKGFLSVRYQPVRIRFPFGYEQDFRLPRDEVYETDSPGKAHVVGELRSAGGALMGGIQVCLRQGAEERCVTANRLGQYSLLVAPGKWQAVLRNRKEVVWRQNLMLGKPGEYRNAIRIRPPVAAPPRTEP